MRQKILCITSSGGHWEQMMLLHSTFQDHDVYYATTKVGLAERCNIKDAFLLDDCNRDTPLSVIRTMKQAFKIIRRLRPDVVVSTGAAPGIIAIFVGRLFGAKTIWIDSIANYEMLSMSGRMAGRIAHVQMTQWSHLAKDGGPQYAGSVI